MHPTIENLLARAPLITDGAWGTLLQGMGLAAGECPDGWNLSHPEAVARVASLYVEAGSDVILTNTFRANAITLGSHGMGAQTAQINRAGVEISRRAASSQAVVFASIGPTGKMLLTGEVSEQDLLAAFAEQALALADAGADAILVETVSDLAEARIALEAAKKTGLPVVVSMVFDSGKNHDRTMMGTTPEEVARVLTEAGADVIGANCGQGIEGYIPICSRLKAATDRPVWIKPNAGLPKLVEGEVRYESGPEEFARLGGELVRAGAAFIGGCCGTNPDFVRALRRALRH